MKKGYQVYLEDILESIERIGEYVSEISENEFYEDHLIQDAVLRRLEIIGEAVKGIPDNVRKDHPDIPWRRIAGLRDVLIHAYSGVNLKRVWIIINENLPELKSQLMDVQQSAETDT